MSRALVAAGVLALGGGTTAFAHVEVAPAPTAKAAALGEVIIRVPNESSTADTTSITVKLPDNILQTGFPRVTGWRSSAATVPLASPMQLGDQVVTTRVATVTWTGGRIRPGQRGDFRLRVRVGEGSKTNGLAFPTVQRYSDGTVVRWIGPPGSERPAGVLQAPLPVVAVTPTPVPGDDSVTSPPAPATAPATLTATTGTGPSEEGEGRRGLWTGLAVIALVFGGGVFALIRRRD